MSWTSYMSWKDLEFWMNRKAPTQMYCAIHAMYEELEATKRMLEAPPGGFCNAGMPDYPGELCVIRKGHIGPHVGINGVHWERQPE